MIDMNNSSGEINGTFYDFTGYKASLNFDGSIIRVIRILDGEDVTEEMRVKYK